MAGKECGLNKRERLARVSTSFQDETILKTTMYERWQLSFLFHLPIGKPVGWMYPSFHASSRHRNKTTDSTIRHVSARAMFLLRAASCSASLLRSIKNPAAARLTRMAKKKRAMAYVMPPIMESCV